MRTVSTTTDPRSTRARAGAASRLRTGVLLAATTVSLAACGIGDPAATNHLGYEDGAGPAGESSMSTLQAMVLYGLVPLAILLVVGALAWLPGMLRSNRYRPARGWDAAPLWFGGPADPAAAVEAAQPGDVPRGGASGNW